LVYFPPFWNVVPRKIWQPRTCVYMWSWSRSIFCASAFISPFNTQTIHTLRQLYAHRIAMFSLIRLRDSNLGVLFLRWMWCPLCHADWVSDQF
jgi:hypothetical protein